LIQVKAVPTLFAILSPACCVRRFRAARVRLHMEIGMMHMIQNRSSAARDLARALLKYRKQPNVVVLAVACGGVPVAAGIARELHAPLDLMLVHKLGTPAHGEVAMGAVASGGVRLVNRQIVRALEVSPQELECMAARVGTELEQCLAGFRGTRGLPALEDRCVILVDDGVSTGSTMQAAIAALRARAPARIVAAVPVGPVEAISQLRREADEVVCLATPTPFGSIGRWYEEFPEVSAEEVRRLLAERWDEEERRASAGCVRPRQVYPEPIAQTPTARVRSASSVRLHSGTGLLEGTLVVPDPVQGLIVVVKGSAADPFNSRACAFAELLEEHGYATLQFNFLGTDEERADPVRDEVRSDVAQIAERLGRVLDWVAHEPHVQELPVGIFATSVGVAAALRLTAERPAAAAAIVSLSGRPELAGAFITKVTAPVLYLLGGHDERALALNVEAAVRMRTPHRVEVVPGAGALFDEPGKLAQAATHAAAWFERHLVQSAAENRGARLSP
jgi:putative phosphoribosyl transferase